MRSFQIRLFSVEWFLAVLWVVVFSSLSYIALTEQSITVVSRLNIVHVEGFGAVVDGFISLAAALLGAGAMLRLHPYERLLQLLLVLVWLSCLILYLVFFYV